MSAPTTAIDPATGGVLISWTVPQSGSDPITQFDIQIGPGYTNSGSCDGSSFTVISSLSCIIPMSELISTFSLTFDTLVLVKVRAKNSITSVNGGWGTLSPANTDGARIRVVPS